MGMLVKARTSSVDDWVLSGRGNGLAVGWNRGCLVGSSNRRDIKLVRVKLDGLVVTERSWLRVEQIRRKSPVPLWLSYATSDGGVVVGDDNGCISLCDESCRESLRSIFARN